LFRDSRIYRTKKRKEYAVEKGNATKGRDRRKRIEIVREKRERALKRSEDPVKPGGDCVDPIHRV
jgi:hypothetical protein